MAGLEETEVQQETTESPAPEVETGGGEQETPSFSAPESDPRLFEDLNQRFRERNTGVESRRQLQRRLENQEVERQSLLRQQQEQADVLRQIQEALAPEDEEPEYGQEWVRRQFEAQRDGILGEIKPAIEWINEFRERQIAAQQQYRQQQEYDARVQGMVGMLQHAEQEYVATPAGQGFTDRLQNYQRGIAHIYQNAGVQDVRAQTIAHLQRTVEEATNMGIHPAAYVDRVYGTMFPWARQAAGGAQNGDRPQGDPVAQAHARAADSGLAGSLSQGGASKPAVRSKPGQASSASELLTGLKNLKGPARNRIRQQLRTMAERQKMR